jgi:large subunit ribosomal protein L18
MIVVTSRAEVRERRHRRVRQKVYGNPARPRLAVFRSSKHIYAQIIVDGTGRTLLGVSSLDAEIAEQDIPGGKAGVAKAVGEVLARRALERGIKKVVFDRGGFIYHGRVAALAEGARSGGMEF